MANRPGIEGLKRCIKILGSQAAVARECGVGQTAISECLRNGKRVPAEWVLPLERATAAAGEKVSRYQLRHDLYEPRKGDSRKAKRRPSTPEAHP
jgi:DNA-binding transcriptional regulator YdaS (Cro superfamily)